MLRFGRCANGSVRYVATVRLSAFALLGLVSATASADRLIDIPTAIKLPAGDFRLEYSDSFEGPGLQLAYADFGITTSFEGSIRTQQYGAGQTKTTADLTYNVLSPLTDLGPGFAFGVQDIANTTIDGRREFACASWRVPAEGIDGENTADVTLGVFYRSRAFAYAGATLPVSRQVRFLAESDGVRVAVGLEIKPVPRLGLRVIQRGPSTLADLSSTGKL